MKKEGLISCLFIIIILISGCSQQCPPCIQEECPTLLQSSKEGIFYTSDYKYKEVAFYFNHTEAEKKCLEKAGDPYIESSIDECYGLTYRICKDEFNEQNGFFPERCVIIQDFGDMWAPNGNVACGCLYK